MTVTNQTRSWIPDVAAQFFGTDPDNHPLITATFDGTDWKLYPNKRVSVPLLRKIRKQDGVTHVELTSKRTRHGSGRDRGSVSADFSVAELLNEREHIE